MADHPDASPGPALSGPRRALLTLDRARRAYQLGQVEVVALDEVSLVIWRGEFLVILGRSGSGKSTLLHLLGGMDRPTSGSILFEGQELARATDLELTLYRRRHVGFVFQFYNLVPTLTALENLQVAADLCPDPFPPAQALERVGLEHRRDHFPSQLSGGEQQRVALARALVTRPELLLCDEPTGNLDSASATEVMRLLTELNRREGRTVVVISHHAALGRLAHRTVQLRDGKLARIEENPAPTPIEEIQL